MIRKRLSAPRLTKKMSKVIIKKVNNLEMDYILQCVRDDLLSEINKVVNSVDISKYKDIYEYVLNVMSEINNIDASEFHYYKKHKNIIREGL